MKQRQKNRGPKTFKLKRMDAKRKQAIDRLRKKVIRQANLSFESERSDSPIKEREAGKQVFFDEDSN